MRVSLRFVCLFSLCSLSLCSFVGCAHHESSTLRRIDGKIHEQTYVSPDAYQWFIEGEHAWLQSHHAQALTCYQRAASLAQDPMIEARYAEALAATNQTDDAQQRLRQAQERWPNAETLMLAQGRIAEAAGDEQEALEAYQRASELAPESAEGLLHQSHVLQRRGQQRRALALWAHAPDKVRFQLPALKVQIALALAKDTRTDFQSQDTQTLRELATQLAQRYPGRIPWLRVQADTAAAQGKTEWAAVIRKVLTTQRQTRPSNTNAAGPDIST